MYLIRKTQKEKIEGKDGKYEKKREIWRNGSKCECLFKYDAKERRPETDKGTEEQKKNRKEALLGKKSGKMIGDRQDEDGRYY